MATKRRWQKRRDNNQLKEATTMAVGVYMQAMIAKCELVCTCIVSIYGTVR